MEWKHLMKPGLQAACEARGIAKKGSKLDMIERLEDYERSKDANAQEHGAPPRPPIVPTQVDYLDVSDLTEAELKQRCVNSYTCFRDDAYGDKRRAIIKTEYSTKIQDLCKARDDAIEKARNKCKEGVKNLAEERNDMLANLNAEVDAWAAKQNIWSPSWKRLKEINDARGTFVHASMFSPENYHRPAQQGLPTPAVSSSPKVASPALSSVRHTATAAITSTSTTAKRREAEADDEDEVRYTGRRRISNDEHATDSTAQSNSSRIESSRTNSNIQSLRSKLDGPYIFLTDRTIRNESRERAGMASLLRSERFVVKRLLSDESGFYWVFEDTRQGDREAEACYDHFQGRLYNGENMRLELHRRRVN